MMKIAWYLEPCLDQIESICMEKWSAITPNTFPKIFDSCIPSRLSKIQKIIRPEESGEDFDMLLIHNNKKIRKIRAAHPNIPSFDVDDLRQPFSASNFVRAANFVKSGISEMKGSELTNDFVKFLSSNQKSKVLLIGTGPNLEQSYNQALKSEISIACNSIVKDPKAIEYFNPQIVVAADPVFHVGASSYAEAFRSDLNSFLKNNRTAHFVAPMQHKIIYDSIIAPELKRQLNYFSVDSQSELNIDLFKSTEIRGTNNILTLFMLPIAASIASEIHFAGFDGNRNIPLLYFWKHNKNTQYTELLKSAKQVDPVFFRRSFAGYYKKHVNELDSYLDLIQSKGIKLRTITETYIESLRAFE